MAPPDRSGKRWPREPRRPEFNASFRRLPPVGNGQRRWGRARASRSTSRPRGNFMGRPAGRGRIARHHERRGAVGRWPRYRARWSAKRCSALDGGAGRGTDPDRSAPKPRFCWTVLEARDEGLAEPGFATAGASTLANTGPRVVGDRRPCSPDIDYVRPTRSGFCRDSGRRGARERGPGHARASSSALPTSRGGNRSGRRSTNSDQPAVRGNEQLAGERYAPRRCRKERAVHPRISSGRRRMRPEPIVVVICSWGDFGRGMARIEAVGIWKGAAGTRRHANSAAVRYSAGGRPLVSALSPGLPAAA